MSRRVLLVHAHPDDESITTGVIMARHVAEGDRVCLVTCTRGEQGEVIGEHLAALTADRDDTLGTYREGELDRAMAALGVRDHRFLGEAVGARYRDSGMAFDAQGQVVLPDDVRPEAFALADVDVAAAQLADVIAELRPDLVITYDVGGGYGHPDHVQARRVCDRAVELAAPRWAVPTYAEIVIPESVAAQQLEQLAATDHPFLPVPADAVRPSNVVPDDEGIVAVDGTAHLAAKVAAMRAHATQVSVAEPFFALSNRIGQVIAPVEYLRPVGTPPSG